ncbi:hypothetical protein BDW27_12313 [Nocardiopsis sp. L17-MgMaSL7]|nr:hypothetical protein BDW27_12313 [Nocardiopsis sp. L17-MgMaSL7]
MSVLTWAPGAIVYYHCGVPMTYEDLPRSAYICQVCGATQ